MEEKILNLPGQYPDEAEGSADLLLAYEPLLRKAEAGGLFLFSRSSHFDLWLSPKEFKSFARQGSVWLERKWILKDPKIRMMELERDIYLMREELRSLQSEISGMRSNDNSAFGSKN